MVEIDQFSQKFKLTSKDIGTVCRLFVLAVGRLSTNLCYGAIHWLSLCLLLICANSKMVVDRSRQEAERSPLASWLTPNVRSWYQKRARWILCPKVP